MKRLKKISTFILALVFIFALTINVFGATVADGDYTITCNLKKIEGETKRTIEAATLHVAGGQMTADVTIDSEHYTWMSIDGITFY